MEHIWTIVNGAWGDALACYGNICKLLDERGEDKANAVYFGLDPKVADFLAAQERIAAVRRLIISEPGYYFQYAGLAASDFQAFTRVTGLAETLPEIWPTHIGRYYNIENPTLCHRDFSITLPSQGEEWSQWAEYVKPYILVQPFSCHSCTQDMHWPHWEDAVRWVLDSIQGKVVLVGELTSTTDPAYKFPWFEHSNLVNLVGQTESVVDVFHLMAGANGVLTTSNSLSMWSIVTKKPALVVCNQIIQRRAEYYYNWIHHEPNTVLDVETTLDDFKKAFREWFPKVARFG